MLLLSSPSPEPPSPPSPRRQVSSRTRRQGHKQWLLSEELQKVVLFGRTGLHEIFTVLIQASHLEDVDHVVNIKLSMYGQYT